jgi:hypothetical protein
MCRSFSRYAHASLGNSSLYNKMVNKVMFIGGYNTERSTRTAAPPASPARHEHAPGRRLGGITDPPAPRSNRRSFTFSAQNYCALSRSIAAGLTLRRFSRAIAAISNRQLFAILKSAFARVISSDRVSHNACRPPLPTHYNFGVFPCRDHSPKTLTTP